jgi:beta-galactosidase
LRADGSDGRLVFIDVVDANGTVVPTASDSITLGVTGPGVILGPPVVQVKGGQLATWVRAGRTPGTITVTASAPGLDPGSVDLTGTPVANVPPLPADR